MSEEIWENWPRLFPPWSKEDPATFDSLRRVLINWKVENTPKINDAFEKLDAIRKACDAMKNPTERRAASPSQIILWTVADAMLTVLDGDQSIGEKSQ